MKAIALAALAASALATPAFAGPYVESKHEFKGMMMSTAKLFIRVASVILGKLVASPLMLKEVWVFPFLMVVIMIPLKHWKLVAN